MALIALNTFKTKTASLIFTTNTTGTSTATIYTAPIGVTAIVLMSQVTNTTNTTRTVNFGHFRSQQVLPDAQGNGAQPGNTFTPLVTAYKIPGNDATSLTTGKMIIESLDSIRAWSDQTGALKITLSVLETANA
jgi:hypothetical protein